ncbi:hypothetical protein K503DRAFT_786312 [Rhizopogon vinicolor AM-OR11-026]|uniref:Dynamin N-terminal domain-containing protein n=1 Tax=Rhizopogon vinicolor AM-OR11-026 TaxID=1314800 RepID=A0A1B7MM70_9AGAM|nr:hypothetical protein K503DRAFT_786312 [Rhizopogon vinicolor AM-OR11-026]
MNFELKGANPRSRENNDKDLGGWKADAKKLSSTEPRARKLAFIGRTGAGKSTAINALLGASVLSTRADGACTSVQTEVIYENLPPSAWRASITFVGADHWRKLGSMKAIYPHLRALPFPPPPQDTNTLLQQESVATILGTEIQLKGTSFDTLESEEMVGEQPLRPFVWRLVNSVRIYGAFDVLASGAVTIVDVPGFGDANKTRTKRTEEYLKCADVVVLVADIKRAADDQAIRDYFEKLGQLTIALVTKDTYVAHQRSARVKEGFLQLYRQVYYSVAKDSEPVPEPPPLPIFCVGSTDFNKLRVLGMDRRRTALSPLVFTDPEDTGIPQLCRHIQDFGYKQVLSDISALVTNCHTLWEDIESFYLSSRQDSRLASYESAARSFVEVLRDSINEARKETGGKIDDGINKLERALRIEAEKAAERSIGIIELLSDDYRFQGYRALMRRNGEWRSDDLNEDLVDGIFDGSASSVWHKFFNDSLGSELKLLVETSLHMLDCARQEYLSGVLKMQRELSRGPFKELIRDELKDHYLKVGKECGKGMYQRMKDLNEEQFGEEKGKELYARLIDRVMKSIRMTRNKGETAIDEALDRLYSSIDRSLVCMQGNSPIANAKRKMMQKFLAEECSTPLEEVIDILGRYALILQ